MGSRTGKTYVANLQKLADIFEVDFFDLIQEQVPNVDLSNAKFENSSCLAFDSTINFQSQELIDKILENQQQMAKLMESQSKLIESLLKK